MSLSTPSAMEAGNAMSLSTNNVNLYRPFDATIRRVKQGHRDVLQLNRLQQRVRRRHVPVQPVLSHSVTDDVNRVNSQASLETVSTEGPTPRLVWSHSYPRPRLREGSSSLQSLLSSARPNCL